ncbi:hypothetical protein [Agrobacterium salinitolerans]|uniref:hypothetical protein n=1 Tax=Agrobacterium salinitolerans TaxID=1183413 RepID=UPI0022B81D97|nr:hypothetical protein [Agrobacterium salinitolerans]MCZ7886059.1 hypothetical protein [Agrobacterium salinitolerans]
MTALYTSGTISLVNGSAVITGIDTAWKTALIVGGTVHVEAEGNPLPILPDDSAGASEHPITDTEMTAAIKWQGLTGTYKYALVRENTYTETQAANSVKIAELLQRLNHPTIAAIAGVQGQQDHLILLTGASTATIIPRTSLIQGIEANATVETPAGLSTYESEAAGFIVLVSNAGDQRAALYFKVSATAGDWSDPAFLTGEKGDQGDIGPTGIRWAGAWNNVDAYAKNDVVRNNKSAWIALRANTNVAPPVLPTEANDAWELFARAGVDGTGTGDVVAPTGGVTLKQVAGFGTTDGKSIVGLTQAEVIQSIGGLPIRGYLSPGFNLANNATDATNDLDFPAGVVASETANSILMAHSAGTAQLDVAYGSGNGGRFDSAISDGTWHCFIISNGTTTSRGFSKSLDPTTQPNYPAGFTHYRRVASWPRISGALAKIIQRGNYFWHSTRISDLSVFDPGTAAVVRTLSVPTGISVIAFGKAVIVVNPASGSNNRFLLLTSLAQADVDPAMVGGTIALSTPAVPSATLHRAQGDFTVETNTSAQIRSRMNISDSAVNNQIITEGWIDYRGTM